MNQKIQDARSDLDRAMVLADKITAKAEDALADLKHEMLIQKWPPDLRKIMWDAVAQVATAYAEESLK